MRIHMCNMPSAQSVAGMQRRLLRICTIAVAPSMITLHIITPLSLLVGPSHCLQHASAADDVAYATAATAAGAADGSVNFLLNM